MRLSFQWDPRPAVRDSADIRRAVGHFPDFGLGNPPYVVSSKVFLHSSME